MRLVLRIVVLTFFLCCHCGMTAMAAMAASPTSGSLKIALVHYAVKHKDPARNLKALLELNRKAARQGARLILNTELALSGYSFSSRQDIAPYTETAQGKTMVAMAALAREQKVYIGITFPEQDPVTQSYYNSAFVLDPGGKTICRYRKIYGERRWARPGRPFFSLKKIQIIVLCSLSNKRDVFIRFRRISFSPRGWHKNDCMIFSFPI